MKYWKVITVFACLLTLLNAQVWAEGTPGVSKAGIDVKATTKQEILSGLTGYDLSMLDEQDSATVIKYLGRWVSMFLNYSGFDMSEELNFSQILGQYAELVQMEELSANLELAEITAEFQRSTFMNVYTIPIVSRDEYVFQRLNRAMESWHSPVNSPHVFIYVTMIPSGPESFEIELSYQSPYVSGNMLEQMNSQADEALNGVQYTRVGESKSAVNAELSEGLGLLASELGTSLFPPTTIWYEGNPYGDGQEIELWSGSGTATFYAAKKRAVNQDSFALDLTYGLWWTDPNQQAAESYYNLNTVPGRYNLTFQHGEDNERIVLGLNIKEGTGIPSLRSVLKSLVREILQEKRTGVTDALLNLRSDSVAIGQELLSAQTNNTRGTIRFEGQGDGVVMESFLIIETIDQLDQILVSEPAETLNMDEDKVSIINAERKQFINITKIKVNENVIRFLESVIDDPASFNNFLNTLIEDSGRVFARLLLDLPSDSNTNQAKLILSDFLNEKIDEVSYNSIYEE